MRYNVRIMSVSQSGAKAIMQSYCTESTQAAVQPTAAADRAAILIVDGDCSMHAHYDAMLHRAGLALLGPVQKCEQARTLLGMRQPQAAILDVNVGAEDIWDLADMLQARGIYFLLTSASPLSAEHIPSKYKSCVHLTKPMTREQVLMALRLVCDRLD